MSEQRVTLAEWAARHGRTVATAYTHWTRDPTFPTPLGTRPRPGGGPGRRPAEYDEAALDQWLASHPGMRPPPPVAYDGGLDELVTLSAFAARAHVAGKPVDRKTIYQYRDRPDFPGPTDGNRYRASDVLTYLNNRPGSGNHRRHTPSSTPGSDENTSEDQRR